MINFVPPHNDKIRMRFRDLMPRMDVALSEFEDAMPAAQKENARKAFNAMAL